MNAGSHTMLSGSSDERETIARIRNSLLAEHLNTNCDMVVATLNETGSLIETIERLRGDGRSLRVYEVPEIDAVRAWLADNKVLDPEGPGEMFEALSRRKPLLGRLRSHFRRDDSAISRNSGLVLGGLAVGTALFAVAAIKARKR